MRVVRRDCTGSSKSHIVITISFVAIALILLIMKLTVIDTWSWWRVILPLGLFVGFAVTNIVFAFIYLSFAPYSGETRWG